MVVANEGNGYRHGIVRVGGGQRMRDWAARVGYEILRTAMQELADRLDELSPRVPGSCTPDLDPTQAAESVALAHEGEPVCARALARLNELEAGS